MLLHTAAAAAATVTMNDPTIRVVSSVKQMRDHCGIEGAYDACTQFLSYRLEASCIAGEASWRIRTSASISPSIVLFNLGSLAHENEHIADMTGSIEKYVASLEASQFDSVDVCHDVASSAMTGFASTVRGFAQESLALRDPATRPSRTDRARRR